MDTKPKTEPTDFDLERAVSRLHRSSHERDVLLTSPVICAGAFLYPSALNRRNPAAWTQAGFSQRGMSADSGSQ
jgi:hypothetical protein